MIKILGTPVLKDKVLLLASDITILVAAAWLAVLLRLDYAYISYVHDHAIPFAFQIVSYITCFYVADLYDVKREFWRFDQVLYILITCVIAMSLSAIGFYTDINYVGRGIFFLYAALVFLSITLVRYSYVSLSSAELFKKRILIVGAGAAGRNMLCKINKYGRRNYDVIGFIDDNIQDSNDVPVLGTSDDLENLIEKLDINLLIICIAGKKNERLLKTLIKCHYYDVQILDMPTMYECITGKLPLYHINQEWLLMSAMSNHRLFYSKIKRMVDVALSVLLLTLTSPIIVLAAVAIKLNSAGPVTYKQERIGRDYKKFNIYKLRTMVQDAEEKTGAVWASKNDPRITSAGNILRKLRIDELPQLFNVLNGDMSFVGPRPEREVFTKEFDEEIPGYGYRLLVKPGITGWAQVMYAYASSKDETKEKLRYDLYYIKNMSVALDLLILLKTIKTVLFLKGH